MNTPWERADESVTRLLDDRLDELAGYERAGRSDVAAMAMSALYLRVILIELRAARYAREDDVDTRSDREEGS